MTDLTPLAVEALGFWGGLGTPRLISQRENAVFEVEVKGARAALRLHRAGYRTPAEINSELMWSMALAEAGLDVPQPIPSRSGALVHRLSGGQDVSVTSWVDGQPIGEAETPLGENAVALHHEMGVVLARLHQISDRWTAPAEFTRPPWDRQALTGPDPAWGRYWENPALRSDERDLILQVRDIADAVLGAKAFDMGLIHADALRENVFQTDQGLTLIDFDDCGVGYRLYDLATALIQSLDDPRLPEFAQSLVAGYRTVRPLKGADHLHLFLMLRQFSSLGWMMPRYGADDPKQWIYAGRAVRLARAQLEGMPAFDVA